MHFNTRSMRAFAVIAGALLLVSKASAQEMRLSDVYRVAREKNPRIEAVNAVIAARRALEPGAGLPADPELSIGAAAPSVQVMQMLPLFGKLGAQKRVAEQATDIARAEAVRAWWEVRAEAAMSFYEVYLADEQLTVMRETLELLQNYRQVAQAMYASGEGRQTDVLRAGVEVARMDADIKRMTAMRAGAVARLNATLDQPADTRIGAALLPELPAVIPAMDTLRAWGATSPMLGGALSETDQAATRVALARKELWPDLKIGYQYGRNDMQQMGSVMIGFSVPVFAAKRQLKMREEAEAMRAMAQADLQKMRALVDARIATLVADLDRSRTLIGLYMTDILPQATANVQSAFSSYRVGKVDFMTLVDAQMTVNKYKQELTALIAEYGSDIAELEMTIGRELPASAALIAERR